MLKKISGPRSDYPSHTYSMESIKIKKKTRKICVYKQNMYNKDWADCWGQCASLTHAIVSHGYHIRINHWLHTTLLIYKNYINI